MIVLPRLHHRLNCSAREVASGTRQPPSSVVGALDGASDDASDADSAGDSVGDSPGDSAGDSDGSSDACSSAGNSVGAGSSAIDWLPSVATWSRNDSHSGTRSAGHASTPAEKDIRRSSSRVGPVQVTATTHRGP